jgi:pteridine reductase
LNHANKQVARVALVTGAARRIGATIAHYLHQAGFRVVIHCHQSLQEATALAQILNSKKPHSALVLTADLTIKQDAINLITETILWAGQLDLLVNNASIFTFTSTEENALDDEQWNKLFTTNVKAPYWLSYTAHAFLAKQKGAIINITDIHAEHPLKGYSVYCQSKAALTMQTKSLAREFAPNVRVNAVAPGAIAWPENNNALSDTLQQKIIAETPLKQHGNPIFIAQAVLALADNPFITGQTLNVDGGRSLI